MKKEKSRFSILMPEYYLISSMFIMVILVLLLIFSQKEPFNPEKHVCEEYECRHVYNETIYDESKKVTIFTGLSEEIYYSGECTVNNISTYYRGNKIKYDSLLEEDKSKCSKRRDKNECELDATNSNCVCDEWEIMDKFLCEKYEEAFTDGNCSLIIAMELDNPNWCLGRLGYKDYCKETCISAHEPNECEKEIPDYATYCGDGCILIESSGRCGGKR